MAKRSALEELVLEIKSSTKQVSQNRVDEVRVMKEMLNDKDFSIGVYDKNMGYIGQRCPREEAIKFTKGVIAGATGLDQKDSQHLAENYEFTKKDANFLLQNMRDFMQVYMTTGRKINIMQTAATEAYLYTKDIPAAKKTVPDKENPGKSKQIVTAPYTKLISQTRAPKYGEKEED